jgi:hypothetical protein
MNTLVLPMDHRVLSVGYERSPNSIPDHSIGNCCLVNGTWIGFSPSSSIYSCQIIPPLLRTHRHLHTTLTPRVTGQEAWGHKNNNLFFSRIFGITGKKNYRQPSFWRETEHCKAGGRKKVMVVWLSWSSYLNSKGGDILIPLHHGPVISSTWPILTETNVFSRSQLKLSTKISLNDLLLKISALVIYQQFCVFVCWSRVWFLTNRNSWSMPQRYTSYIAH